MMPALQKSTSIASPFSSFASFPICSTRVTSATRASTPAGSFAFASRTVPITRQPSAAYWRASSSPSPRPAPLMRIALNSVRNRDVAERGFEERALVVVAERTAERLRALVVRLLQRALVVRRRRIGHHRVRECVLPRRAIVRAHVLEGFACVVQCGLAVAEEGVDLPEQDRGAGALELVADLLPMVRGRLRRIEHFLVFGLGA